MTQQGLIGRASRALLEVLTILLRIMGALCATFGSVLLILFSADKANDGASSDDALEDGLSMIEREDEAIVSGWKSW